MRRYGLAAILIFAVCGCLVQPTAVGPSKPTPKAATLDAAAEKSARDYAAGLAGVCREVAKDIRANKYKAQSQVYDEFKKRSEAVRTSAMGTWERKLGEVAPPSSTLESEKLATALETAATGFERASK